MSDVQSGTEQTDAGHDTASPLVMSICSRIASASPYTGNADYPAIAVSPDSILKVMERLKDDPEFDFSVLFTHMAIDRVETVQFELLYFLHSLNHTHRLLVSVTISRQQPVIPSVCSIWKIAEWQEREVFDLFGVQYTGHPDLRRIFLEDDWQGFPLRKDYVDDFMLTREDEAAAS